MKMFAYTLRAITIFLYSYHTFLSSFFGDFERFDTRDKHVKLHILHAIDQQWQQQNKRTKKGLYTGESGKKTNNSDEKPNSFSQ